MKFVLANLIAFGVISAAAIWPIWSVLDLHWAIKIAMSLAVVVAAGFFEERILSRMVNRLVSKLFPETKPQPPTPDSPPTTPRG
jgi:hypothetical protein